MLLSVLVSWLALAGGGGNDRQAGGMEQLAQLFGRHTGQGTWVAARWCMIGSNDRCHLRIDSCFFVGIFILLK